MHGQDLEGALAHPTRRRLIELIGGRPGLSMSELARGAGIFWTAAAFHVDRLERMGAVTSVRIGRVRALFLTETLKEVRSNGFAILAEPACLKVGAAIAHHPNVRVWELSELTGMSERATYHHLKRLVEAGLVTSRKTGGYRGLEPTPLLLMLLPQGDLLHTDRDSL